MRVALLNVEPKIFNTAYMQISQYHKNKGDFVEWYSPLQDAFEAYNKIYVSKLFFKTKVPKWIFTDERVSYGGTGFHDKISERLPEEIENCDYDYSLYPKMNYSIVWFSRGCIRNCSFCLVREKEGYIYPVDPKPLNPNGEFIRVMDNNFFASPKWSNAIEQLQKWNQPVQFDGIDVRLLNEEQLKSLKSLKIKGQIHIAWDNPKEKIDEHIKRVLDLDIIKAYKFMCYVLVGYNTSIGLDLYRIKTLRKLKIDPFVMIYNNRKDKPILRHLARYVNRKQIYRSCTFEEYLETKTKGEILISSKKQEGENLSGKVLDK